MATPCRSRATWGAARASTERSPRFAEAYADQNQRDYEAVRAAVDAGTIVAAEGV
jgi:hypothetical protein